MCPDYDTCYYKDLPENKVPPPNAPRELQSPSLALSSSCAVISCGLDPVLSADVL